MSEHSCQTLIFRCMDFRIKSGDLKVFLDDIGCPEGAYDLVSVAGSARDLLFSGRCDFLLKQITLSVTLHDIKELVVLLHDDCGAYGIPNLNKEDKTQRADLVEIQDVIFDYFPILQFRAYIIKGVPSGKLSLQRVI